MSEDLAIYIHWPFCESKCPYCDFNSHVADAVDQNRWREALLTELATFAGETAGRQISSVFFGGGTPSLMPPETVAALIEAIKHHWPVKKEIEITLEANPSSVEAGRFQAYRDAGVNRVSIGVQSFDPDALKFLGRRHDVKEARDAIAIAAKIFDRYSFDLIYARPGQTISSWREELTEACALADGHLSVYQLTIEPGTAFHLDHIKGCDEETGAALYEATQDILESHGMPAYEISNHARPGHECRHNLTYWHVGDWLGVGPGAHGRLRDGGHTITLNQTRMPMHWLEAVEAQGHGTVKRTTLSEQEEQEEIFMMGLRLSGGIERVPFENYFNAAIEDTLDAETLRDLIASDFIELDDRGLRATAQGRQRLNAVLGKLLS